MFHNACAIERRTANASLNGSQFALLSCSAFTPTSGGEGA